jgi:putative membrane protein
MMKRINYKKRAVIHGLSMAVFLGACLGLQANDQDNKGVSAQATVNTDRSTTSSTDRNRDRTYTSTTDRNYNNGKLSRGDANFIREAAQGGMMEVKLGQTAKDHAQNSDVKNYGEMLVKDHSKANDKLSQLASEKGVNLAKDMEPKHTDMIKDFEKKSGADFDRDFIEHAIKDHRKDISKFERASRDLNDSELKAFATETLPTLRNHLAEAERIAKGMGLNVTARNVDTDINHDRTAESEAAAAAGSPGLATSSANRSVNRVDVDVNTKDRAPGGRADLDVDRNHNNTTTTTTPSVQSDVNINKDNSSGVEGKAEVKTDKGDGKTLGIETQPGDNKTLGVETQKGDHKVLGIKTEPGDGKTLGLNTRKDDGKILGIFPAPGRHKAENRVDVDVDKSDHNVELNANTDRDHDASIGAPATSEKGASANAEVHTDKDHSARATTLSYNDLPAKVQDTIKAQGGSTDNVKNVKKHTTNGKTVYQVKLNNKTLRIDEDGTIVKESGK